MDAWLLMWLEWWKRDPGRGVAVKVILETCCLTLEQIRKSTQVCAGCGGRFCQNLHRLCRCGSQRGGGAGHAGSRRRPDQGQGFRRNRDYAAAKRYVDLGVDRLGVGFGSTAVICQGEADACQ